jgi:colicin import membrane protein
MPAASDRAEFAPPPQPAAVQAFVMAIIAHLLLLLALTWGINWKRESDNVVAEAELWSSVPQQAAPRVVQAPPIAAAPNPVPAPPPPPPAPAPREAAPPPPPVPAKQPDIALEREKQRQELAERRRQELEEQKKIDARVQREELDRQKKLEARKQQDELKREQLAQQKADEDRKRREDQAKASKDKQREQAETKRLAALREENMRRMQGLAGATGAPSATGTADRSAGPSTSYAGRIRARVKPNITFTDDIPGNPSAEVEVQMAPDGTITSRRLTKSSGVGSWDQAVLRALDKTEVLPRDIDGRVHTPLIIEFKLRG